MLGALQLPVSLCKEGQALGLETLVFQAVEQGALVVLPYLDVVKLLAPLEASPAAYDLASYEP